MRRFEVLFLIVLAVAAFSASAAMGYVDAGLASFGRFYTAPIRGDKCARTVGPDPFWIDFYDLLGLFSIPWTLVLIFFLLPNRRRTQ